MYLLFACKYNLRFGATQRKIQPPKTDNYQGGEAMNYEADVSSTRFVMMVDLLKVGFMIQ